MFTEVLCTIAKAWKQSKHPFQDKWIKTMWNIIQSLKKENLAIRGCTEFEGILLSEISQTDKDKHCIISLISGIKKKIKLRTV